MATRGTFIFIHVKTARSRSDGHGEARFSSLHRDAWSVRPSSDGGEDSWKKSTIVARSIRDRGSFITESMPRSSYNVCLRIESTIDAQSWPDRGTIVAHLKQNRGSFNANPEAITPPRGITPTTHSNRSHDRNNQPRFSGEFSLEKHVFSLLLIDL